MNLLSKKLNINFMQYSKYTIYISLILMIIGIYSFFNLGIKKSIDFTGGTIIHFIVKNSDRDISKLREHLKYNLDENIVVVEKEKDQNNSNFLLTMSFIDNEEKIKNILDDLYGKNYTIKQIESIGPKIGNELSSNARDAILVAMLLIGLYISLRFDSFYALGSLVALIHDVAITLSILIFLQYEISISIIAALLTIVGYSLNDTIVIYDRIRENMRLNTERLNSEIINKSLNISLNRTIITSLTTLMVAMVLYLFGGRVLQPFSMALIIGVILGTYSSIFIASPVTLFLEEKYNIETEED